MISTLSLPIKANAFKRRHTTCCRAFLLRTTTTTIYMHSNAMLKPIFHYYFKRNCHAFWRETRRTRSLSAIVHSIAYAPKHASLLETTRDSFQVAHDISAYSFLETAREALPLLQPESSLTTLSYLGAVRAVPNYQIMGAAKASLESLVRGLALELGSPPYHIRVNSVSAGPLNTLSARGITGISELRNHVEQHAPLKCNITAKQVADTIVFLATKGTGITGQTIYVDGGYSIVAGP